MNISLQNKIAIVTGAMSGIGLAITRRYLDSGITGLVAVDRQTEMPEVLLPYQEKYGSKLIVVRGDVSQPGTAEQFTRAAMERFGRIDVFVNNAGISSVRPIHEHTPEEWDAVMNTNVKALYWAAREMIPVMIRQKSGLILNTGSISGEAGIPGQGAYAASKGAIHQITRQMAVEYAKYGIRVNSIALGTVDTPIVHKAAKESGDEAGFWKMLRDNHPIGRIANADEVGAFFAFMASDYATFFTGSVLMMDGGYTAH
jgi:NAD(P)-dependent dehydrogenase (short-subunit alcohol dehydrogenase family)